ncbi:uncharacterized protein LOC113272773 [Papaver somniferum]|uniref:uncharacterized protein LOC113272773 n=1 Tax=Papaver somniferum TaxID=3469 RepID=UPI000E70268A|nr:uncharacterized protein LOC113272773 [Papaver somniferum]
MKDIVINAWQQIFYQHEAATAGQKLLTKMKETSIDIQQWHKQTFGHLPELLKEAEFQIQLAQLKCATTTGTKLLFWLQHENETRNSHLMLLHYHAEYWKQRSRIEWLNNGDLNTRFFHTKATINNRINHIHQLQDANQRWVYNQSQIIKMMIQHYEQQYIVAPTDIDMQLFANVNPRISQYHCLQLMRTPTTEEIHKAL